MEKKIFSNENINWNTSLSNFKKDNKTPSIIGFALDGYPIYDAYSIQKDSEETSVIMHSSYQLKNIKEGIVLKVALKRK